MHAPKLHALSHPGASLSWGDAGRDPLRQYEKCGYLPKIRPGRFYPSRGQSRRWQKKAVFYAAIPYSGQWNLELYLPPQLAIFLSSNRYPNPKWGDWHLTVKDGNGDAHEIEFDSNAASDGWNLAGSLALPEGKAFVILSNETDGDCVIADAIRWAPVEGR